MFQDGNDKLILEALVNFFFMGDDSTDQVKLTASVTPQCDDVVDVLMRYDINTDQPEVVCSDW